MTYLTKVISSLQVDTHPLKQIRKSHVNSKALTFNHKN